MLIDTHCHLDFPEFDQDRDEVIKRARDGGIEYIINIGSSLEGSIKSLALSQQYDFIYATCGLHPHEADRFSNQVQSQLEELARKDKVVAIGEIGLDYYKNYSKADGLTASFDKLRTSPERSRGTLAIGPEWNRRTENQKTLFISLVKLAKDLGLPVVVHTRQAQTDTLKILKNALPLEAVVHCFSGDENFLKECLDLGFFVSFTCNITYPAKLFSRPMIKIPDGIPLKTGNSGRDPASGNKTAQRDNKATQLRRLVEVIPLERLLLETDAPFLPPEGFRGTRNEPAYVKYLAEEVARIKEISIEEVAEITSSNAKNFFKVGS